MKSNWQIKKLEEVCEVFADGDWIEKKDQSISGIRLIQTSNIGNGYFLDRSEKARYISEDTFKRLRCTEVLQGDCLLSRLPDPVGRAGLIPDIGQKMITAVDCTIMRFKKDTLPKWFIYYSLSPGYQKEINKEVTGATRQRISRSNLGNIEISVPPIPEQKRIVKILDGAFEKIAKAKENAEKNLQNARELFESYLHNVFTNPGDEWMERKLGEVCEVFADGDWIEKKDQSISGIRLIQTGNIGNGYFSNRGEKARYISEDTFKRLRCTEVLPGDCLLSRLPDPVGRAGLIPDTGQKMITAVDCTIMRFKKDTLPKWFIYFSLSPDYQKEINKEVTGATRQRISRSNLGNIEIPVPPISEQKRIVKILGEVFEKTVKLEAIYQQKLNDLEELKKSILQKAFKGELIGV